MDIFAVVAASVSTLALGLTAGLAMGERKRKRRQESGTPPSSPTGLAAEEPPELEERNARLEETPEQGLWAGSDTGVTDLGHGFVPPVSSPTRGRWAPPLPPLSRSGLLEGGAGAPRAGEDARGEAAGASVPALSSMPEFFDL